MSRAAEIGQEVANIGKSFSDGYLRGTKMRMAKEQEMRARRKDAFSYLDRVTKTLDSLPSEEARNAHIGHVKGTEEWNRAGQILGSKTMDIQVKDGVSVLTDHVDWNTAVNSHAQNMGITPEQAVKSLTGMGFPEGSTMRGSKYGVDINSSFELQSKRLAMTTAKTDIMKKQTEIAGAGRADFKDTQELRKEYSNNVIVKEGRKINAAVSRMNSVWINYKENSNIESRNALDQALVITFNKMMDPGSVVRESEYARTPKGQSFLSQLQGYADKISKGGVGLTDPERGEIVRISKLLQEGHDNEIQKINKQYIQEAKLYNIDPSRIIGESYSKKEGNNDPLGLF